MAVFFGVSFQVQFGVTFGNYYSSGVSFTTDATSGKVVPASTSEWSSLLSAQGIGTLSAPTHIWKMQEASGNVLDSGASTNLTTSNVLYQKAVTGWSRKAIGGTGSSAGTITGALVNTGTTSFVLLTYARFDTATLALRNFVSYGTPVLQLPDNHIRLREGAALASTVNDHSTTVHPLLLCYNITASTLKLYTDLEKLAITFSVASGTTFQLTTSSATDPGFSDFLYSAAWDGGETTDADAKKLITGLGYSPSWT